VSTEVTRSCSAYRSSGATSRQRRAMPCPMWRSSLASRSSLPARDLRVTEDCQRRPRPAPRLDCGDRAPRRGAGRPPRRGGVSLGLSPRNGTRRERSADLAVRGIPVTADSPGITPEPARGTVRRTAPGPRADGAQASGDLLVQGAVLVGELRGALFAIRTLVPALRCRARGTATGVSPGCWPRPDERVERGGVALEAALPR